MSLFSVKWRDPAEPRFPSECHTGMEVIGAVGAATSVASTGMSIIGSGKQAAGQREAGENAYRAALIRNEQMKIAAQNARNTAVQREEQAALQDQAAELQRRQAEAEGNKTPLIKAQAQVTRNRAVMLDQAAEAAIDDGNMAQAIKQREAIEAKRKGTIMAGRARAVMAASGGGVDQGTIAELMAEGEMKFEDRLFEGAAAARSAKIASEGAKYEAALTREDAKQIDYAAVLNDYNAAIGKYESDLTRRAAHRTRFQAQLDRWDAENSEYAGQSAVVEGDRTRSAMNSAADFTLMSGIGGGLARAGGLAARYAGSFSPSTVTASPSDYRGAYDALSTEQRIPGFDADYNPLV
jgi:hypothetical protein